MKLHVKKDDTVVIISGKDKGKIGEIIKVNPKKGKILVNGVNIVKRHLKPGSKKNISGGIVELESFINSSKAMLYCKNCKSSTRIKHEFTDDGSKIRVCKKCSKTL